MATGFARSKTKPTYAHNGLKNQKNTIEKNIGFGVLGLTVIKIFAYDLSHADSSLKVILLLIIGAFIMGISYISNKKDTSKEIDSK